MVRFACERCGKRYAIQGVPVPGRRYRVTCKACGHVIAFTGGEAGLGSGPEPSAAAASEHPQATSVSELLPQAAGSAEANATPSHAVASVPAGPPALEPARAAGPSYIDLFDDHDDEKRPAPADLPVDGPPSWRDLRARPTPPPAPRPPVAGPVRTAARPPEAEERAEVTHEGRVLRRFVVSFAVLWVAILGAAFGVWLWRRNQPPAPPAPGVSTEASTTSGAPAPGPGPQDEPPPAPREPAAPPAPADPDAVTIAPQGGPAVDAGAETLVPPSVPPPPPAPPSPAVEKKRLERRSSAKPTVRTPAAERRARASAPDERAAAVPATPPAASPAAAPPAPDANSSLPEGLAEKEIRKVLDGARKSFQACLRDPSRGMPAAPGERQITLRFNVSPSGQVGYATIDDVEVSSAPVGQCLKKAARGLVFPAFRGDPVRVDAPLSIADR